jgi:hypothetical protein
VAPLSLWVFDGRLHPELATTPGLAGADLTFWWSELSRAPDATNFAAVDQAMYPWTSNGKRVILRVASAGRAGWKGPGNPADATPQWVYDLGVPAISMDDGSRVPAEWDPNYLKALRPFVAALGRRYDGDPRVGLVQIGVGIGGETSPGAKQPDEVAQMYAAGYTRERWLSTTEAIVSIYKTAFHRTPLALMANSGALPGEPSLFASFAELAGRDGLLLEHNGLSPNGYGSQYSDLLARAAHGGGLVLEEGSRHADPASVRAEVATAHALGACYLLLFATDVSAGALGMSQAAAA